jgi:hypothetical protein
MEAENGALPACTLSAYWSSPECLCLWYKEVWEWTRSQSVAAFGLPSSRVVHKSYSSQLGLACWELQVFLPLGKDSTVTEEKQKTKPGPFSSLLVPGRGTGDLLSRVTLRRSSRRLKWCSSTRAGGAV